MAQQFRPRGEQGPMYAPQRDLAHIGPSIIQTAVSAFDEERQTPELKQTLASLQLTTQDICEAVAKFVEAQRLFVYAPQVRNINDAFAETGWDAVRPELRVLIYNQLGVVLTGAWFWCVREVTIVGEATPAAQQVAAMLSVGREIGRRGGYTDVPPVPTETEVLLLQHQNAALTARVAQLLETIEKLRATTWWGRFRKRLRRTFRLRP